MPPPSLTSAQLASLRSYPWPGNIRELQNAIERAVILSRVGPLRLDLPAAPSSHGAPADAESADGLSALQQRERDAIRAALEKTHGKIYGADGAAALLHVKPTTLTSKIKRFGIQRA